MTPETHAVAILSFVIMGLIIGLVTLLLVILIYQRKQLPAADTREILDAIEGGRQQNSAEHMAIQADQKSHGNALKSLLDRFGFLRRLK